MTDFLRALITFLVSFGRVPIHPVQFYVGAVAGVGWWLTGMTWQGLIGAYAVAALGALAVVQHRARVRAERAAARTAGEAAGGAR